MPLMMPPKISGQTVSATAPTANQILVWNSSTGSWTATSLQTFITQTTSTPADPAGTASLTQVMMGLAGSITPTASTRILFVITGQMANNTLNDGCTVQLRFGTGAAPGNGAAFSGTQIGASQTFTALVAAQRDGFAIAGFATGLTIGTAYWIDASLAAITAGTANLFGVTITAHEI